MNKNNKIQIIKVGASLVVVLVLVFVYFSFCSKIKLLSAQIHGAERSIKILEEKRKDLDAASVSLKGFKDEITIIESAFLSEENFVGFVNTLEDFGKKSEVGFIAKEANFSQNGSGQAEFSFSLKGDLKGVYRFLYLLDNSQYSGILRQASIRREGGESKDFTANIDYLIFNFRL